MDDAVQKNVEGLKLYQEGKYEEALRKYNEAIEIDAGYAAPWINRSAVYKKLGREAEADADMKWYESLKQVERKEVSTLRSEVEASANMGFFDKVVGFFQHEDKARHDIYAVLRSLPIDAQMAERGRREEKIGGGGSLGVIDISEGPIRWVNVRKVSDQSGKRYYYTDYVVPDSRLGPNSPKCQIKTADVKTRPVFGEVIDLRWKGKDFGLGIIDRLNSDISLKQPIMDSCDAMGIRADGKYKCWVIVVYPYDALSINLWPCYQAIAKHLLSAPL